MPALISKKTKNWKLWYIVENELVEGKNKRRYLESLGAVSKSEAQHVLAKYTLKKRDEKTGRVKFSSLFNDFLEKYKKKTNVSKNTVKTFEYMSLHFLPLFEHKLLSSIKYSDIEELKTDCLEKGLSPRTINIVLLELKKVLTYAIQVERLESLPLIEYIPISKQNIVERLSMNQVNALLAVSNIQQSFYIQLMLNTGMRPNESLKLKWDNVNINERYIHILSDNRLKLGRKIPINDSLLSLLRNNKSYDNEYVSPYRRNDVAIKIFRRLGKECGFKLTLYMFRKTFGSMMAEAGVQAFDLAKIMGHKNISTTYKYYIDIQHDALRDSMSKMPKIGTNIGT